MESPFLLGGGDGDEGESIYNNLRRKQVEVFQEFLKVGGRGGGTRIPLRGF